MADGLDEKEGGSTWRLWPFFLLHLSSGLSGSLTTLLIGHLSTLKLGADLEFYVTLTATLEDYPPLVLATIGGFLQQLFGARRLLQAAAVPTLLTWIVIIVGPRSLTCLLASRLLAGLANSLLTGNVYMAECAPSQLVPSLKQIEAASRSMGAILIFVFYVIFKRFGFLAVAISGGALPMVAFLGTLALQESPIFRERLKDIKEKQGADGSGRLPDSGFRKMFENAKKHLRIPISKPEVYKPLMLIITITCLQHFSGFTFTKKFLLQVLAPAEELGEKDDKEGEEYTGYYFAILINVIRTVANLMMSGFLKRFRVRFLFCLSLFSTAVCLTLFGCFLPFGPLHQLLSAQADQGVRVAILAVHVFAVQFGLQSLAGQLTDTLLPSHAKPMLKGFLRSVQSLSLIAFVSLITLIPEAHMAWQFWTMAGGLILASPFLYLGVPELRHLGRAAWELYFLPAQTIFYFVIPNAEESRGWQAARTWLNTVSALNGFRSGGSGNSDPKRWAYQRQKTVERVGNENQIATFHPNTLRELKEDETLKKKNKLSVTFVENILGMRNWLTQNPNPDRLILARGPAVCVKEGLAVGVFLFSDVIIVARKLVKNRKYLVLDTIKTDNNLKVIRKELEVTLENGDREFTVRFSQPGNAHMWDQYANYCKKTQPSPVEEDSPAETQTLLD